MDTLIPSFDCMADLGNPKVSGKYVFVFQQVMDDTHVSYFVSFSWIVVDHFT